MLMDINVIGRSPEIYCDDHDGHDRGKIKSTSFLEMVLYYAEGNEILNYKKRNEPMRDLKDKQNIKNSKKMVIPVIQSLYSYFSSLPEVETYIQSLKRQLENNFSVTVLNKPGRLTTNMKYVNESRIFCENLDRELIEHVLVLERIAGDIYEKSCSGLRVKCRINLGDFLHKFMLRAGVTGNISRDKCTSSIIKTGYNTTFRDGISVANTCASGMESIMRLLLRILLGIGVESGRNFKLGHEKHSGDRKDRNNSGTTIATDSLLHDSYRHLLFNILLPLHKPSNMTLWRDQTPVLGVYHKPLVQCICTIVSKDKTLIGRVINDLIHPDVWPIEERRKISVSTTIANSPKVVLLLHEIDTYLSILDFDFFGGYQPSCFGSLLSQGQQSIWTNIYIQIQSLSTVVEPLISRLASCIESDNSRISERALVFFKNKNFQFIIRYNLSTVMTPLLNALCRIRSDMEIPWNPTVRKMSRVVLNELKEYSNVIFTQCCEDLFSESKQFHNKKKVENRDITTILPSSTIHTNLCIPTGLLQLPKVENLQRLKKNDHNNFTAHHLQKISPATTKPPRQLKLKNTERSPGFRVTDYMASSNGSNSRTCRDKSNYKYQEQTTKLLVSGCKIVPPPKKDFSFANGLNTIHAQTLNNELLHPVSFSLQQNEMKTVVNKYPSIPNSMNKHKRFYNNLDSIEKPNNFLYHKPIGLGLERVYRFMDKLKYQLSSNDENGEYEISSWAKDGMATNPVLLPDLKFHDLIFGHILGTGSFSTVKYARQIVRNKTRSSWPEYAVKVC